MTSFRALTLSSSYPLSCETKKQFQIVHCRNFQRPWECLGRGIKCKVILNTKWNCYIFFHVLKNKQSLFPFSAALSRLHSLCPHRTSGWTPLPGVVRNWIRMDPPTHRKKWELFMLFCSPLMERPKEMEEKRTHNSVVIELLLYIFVAKDRKPTQTNLSKTMNVLVIRINHPY